MADDPFKFAMDSGPASAEDAAVSPEAGEGAKSGLAAVRAMMDGNWVLGALFAAGIACLYGMSLMRGPAVASAQQVQTQSTVDDALEKLNAQAGITGKSTNAIVETFYCEARHRQIPPDSLRGNPFVQQGVAPVAATGPAVEAKTAPAVPDRAETDAMNAAKTLRLQSVMMGTRSSAALINGNLLGEGQVILGWTVSAIMPREVHLAWQDKKYVLRMQ
jgi:hypothetical protein